ncbi:hypothetical protein [Amycolatopsis sp. NPDC004079]|uniref:hypothetical protein n=1 Tax=Amycolatopsis sp. NPDC004079 TaxID=3154549 RepID=UPI0033A921C4
MTRSYVDISIAVGRPVDTRALLRECRRLLGTPDEAPPITYRSRLPSGHGFLSNPLFWDFPASLTIEYGIDGPMAEIPSDDASEADLLLIAENPVRNGWAAADVQLQPFVGWPEISPVGATDQDLGAWLVRELGRWLDRGGLPWQWEVNGASVYVPYTSGTSNVAALGDADAGAVTPETIRLVNERYLAEWLRGWRGPSPAQGELLQGWRS